MIQFNNTKEAIRQITVDLRNRTIPIIGRKLAVAAKSEIIMELSKEAAKFGVDAPEVVMSSLMMPAPGVVFVKTKFKTSSEPVGLQHPTEAADAYNSVFYNVHGESLGSDARIARLLRTVGIE